MGRGKHSPPGDKSFAASVVTHIAGAIALVAVVAAAFWGLGQVGEVGDPVISEPPEPTPADEVAAPDDEVDEPEPDPEPVDEPEPADEPEPVDEPEPADEGEPDAVEDEEPQDDDTRAVAPSSVSIQVLDAAGDGGNRASFAAQRLAGDGYRVVAENQAFRAYERTTVFYSDGHETAARQIADEYGYAVVERKPDNLSSSVNVHVVVGQDHPTG